MTKSKARVEVAKIVAEEVAKLRANRVWQFREYIEHVYFPYYSRKWKAPTRSTTINRVQICLVAAFEDRKLSTLNRDELQNLLDMKAHSL